jgi:hypothetical protein
MAVAEHHGAPHDSHQVLENGGHIRAISSSESFIDPDLPATHEDAVAPTYSERQALLYQLLINAVRQHLGLKGVLLHLRIERATTFEDDQALVVPLFNAIVRARDVGKANSFLKTAHTPAGD